MFTIKIKSRYKHDLETFLFVFELCLEYNKAKKIDNKYE